MAKRLRVANPFSALAKKTAGRVVVIERAGFIGLAVFGFTPNQRGFNIPPRHLGIMHAFWFVYLRHRLTKRAEGSFYFFQ